MQDLRSTPAHSRGSALRVPMVFSLIFILFSFLLLPRSLSAESWPQKSGYTKIRFGLTGFRGTGYYGSDGGEIPLQRLEENTYKFYSEYGYSKYVTGIVSLPAYRMLLVQEEVDGPVHRVEAPGDLEVGLRIGVYAGEHDVILLTGMFGIPIGETASKDGLWSGDDEYDQAVLLGYGHSFEALSAKASVQAGYHFRSEGYSDEILVEGEVMLQPISFLQIFLHLRMLQSQGNGNADFLGGRYGFASNDRRFLMYGPELALWITDGFGFTAAAYGISNAENMPNAMVFSTGIFLSVAPSRRN